MEEYVAQMNQRQAAMVRRLKEVFLAAADVHFFERCEGPRFVVVMTEDWCGDSLMNLPIVARIVEVVPEAELRIFVRSEAVGLRRYFEGRGIENIPAVTFFDAAFAEIGSWVERSKAAHRRVEAWREAHPEVAELYGNLALTAEERRRLFEERFAGYITEMEAWYEDGLQQATVDEIRRLLA